MNNKIHLAEQIEERTKAENIAQRYSYKRATLKNGYCE